MKKHSMPEQKTRIASTNNRIRLMLGIFIFVFIVLILYMARWSVVDARQYRSMAQKQWTRARILSASRGDVIDTNGTLLASSGICYSVVLNPESILNVRKIIRDNTTAMDYVKDLSETLAGILDMEPEAVNNLIVSGRRYDVWVKRKIGQQEKERIEQLQEEVYGTYGNSTIKKLKGVSIVEDTQRYYPEKNCLSQILGYTRSDGVGQTGLEVQFDQYLTGADGTHWIVADAFGTEIMNANVASLKPDTPPEDGLTLRLSIDAALQNFSEEVMDKLAQEQWPEKATCILMDPSTARVLANVNLPDFDNNNPPRKNATELLRVSRNTMISSTYEPGAIAKILTLAAALDSETVNEGYGYECTGSRKVGGSHLSCWLESGHGLQNIRDIVSNQCSTAFATLALNLSKKHLYDYFYGFGIGQKTGIELPSEQAGSLPDEKYMNRYDLAALGTGHSLTMTPLQMITAVSSVINGGKLMRPTIVESIENADRQIITAWEPEEVRTVIKPSTSKLLRSYMAQRVKGGSGWTSRLDDYAVGAVSATVQNYDSKTGLPIEGSYTAVTIAFAPASDPKYIALILAEQPSANGYTGDMVTAPYASELLHRCLEYGNVKTEKQDFDISDTITMVPDVTGQTVSEAERILSTVQLDAQIEGTQGRVTAQYPLPNTFVPAGSKVCLCLEVFRETSNEEDIPVPDLTDMTAVEAREKLQSLDLNMEMTGVNGRVTAQWPLPGTLVKADSRIIVRFGTEPEESDPEDGETGDREPEDGETGDQDPDGADEPEDVPEPGEQP